MKNNVKSIVIIVISGENKWIKYFLPNKEKCKLFFQIPSIQPKIVQLPTKITK